MVGSVSSFPAAAAGDAPPPPAPPVERFPQPDRGGLFRATCETGPDGFRRTVTFGEGCRVSYAVPLDVAGWGEVGPGVRLRFADGAVRQVVDVQPLPPALIAARPARVRPPAGRRHRARRPRPR